MRGHQPGTPKTPGSGRTKGTPNKRSLRTREELWAYIEQVGAAANPFYRLVDRMMSTDNEAIEITCAQALADRLLPKLKAVEHTGADGGPIDYRLMPAAERKKRIEELLAKRNGHAFSH